MGLAKKVVHIKCKTLFPFRNLLNINISSTITMKTADYRKKQRTAGRDSDEEKESSPYHPEIPKREKGKLCYSENEERSQVSKEQEMQNAEVSELEHHKSKYKGFIYKNLLRPSGLSRQSVL